MTSMEGQKMTYKQLSHRDLQFTQPVPTTFFCKYTRNRADPEMKDKMTERACLLMSDGPSVSYRLFHRLLDLTTFEIQQKAKRLPGSKFNDADIYTDTLPVAVINRELFQPIPRKYMHFSSTWQEFRESGATTILFRKDFCRDKLAPRMDEFVSQPPTKVLNYTWRFKGVDFEEDGFTACGTFYDEEGVRLKHLLSVMRSYERDNAVVFAPRESWMNAVRMLFLKIADVENMDRAAEYNNEDYFVPSEESMGPAPKPLEPVIHLPTPVSTPVQQDVPMTGYSSGDTDGEETKVPKYKKQFKGLRRGTRWNASKDVPMRICGSVAGSRRLREKIQRMKESRAEVSRRKALERCYALGSSA